MVVARTSVPIISMFLFTGTLSRQRGDWEVCNNTSMSGFSVHGGFTRSDRFGLSWFLEPSTVDAAMPVGAAALQRLPCTRQYRYTVVSRKDLPVPALVIVCSKSLLKHITNIKMDWAERLANERTFDVCACMFVRACVHGRRIFVFMYIAAYA